MNGQCRSLAGTVGKSCILWVYEGSTIPLQVGLGRVRRSLAWKSHTAALAYWLFRHIERRSARIRSGSESHNAFSPEVYNENNIAFVYLISLYKIIPDIHSQRLRPL